MLFPVEIIKLKLGLQATNNTDKHCSGFAVSLDSFCQFSPPVFLLFYIRRVLSMCAHSVDLVWPRSLGGAGLTVTENPINV